VPHPIERHLTAHDVVTDPVRPDLQPPLADTLAFEFLDLGRGTERVGVEALEGIQDLLLCGGRKIIEISLEARGEPDRKAGWHVSQPGESVSP